MQRRAHRLVKSKEHLNKKFTKSAGKIRQRVKPLLMLTVLSMAHTRPTSLTLLRLEAVNIQCVVGYHRKRQARDL